MVAFFYDEVTLFQNSFLIKEALFRIKPLSLKKTCPSIEFSSLPRQNRPVSL